MSMSMYAHFYSGMHFAVLPVLAMLLFMFTFVAAVARVSLRSRRKELEAVSRMPLDDGRERVRATAEPRAGDARRVRRHDHHGARR
jgi:hypothetical protein